MVIQIIIYKMIKKISNQKFEFHKNRLLFEIDIENDEDSSTSYTEWSINIFSYIYSRYSESKIDSNDCLINLGNGIILTNPNYWRT